MVKYQYITAWSYLHCVSTSISFSASLLRGKLALVNFTIWKHLYFAFIYRGYLLDMAFWGCPFLFHHFKDVSPLSSESSSIVSDNWVFVLLCKVCHFFPRIVLCFLLIISFKWNNNVLKHYRPLVVTIYLAYKLKLTTHYCWKGFYYKNIRITITIWPTVLKYWHVLLRKINFDVPELVKHMKMS